MNGLMTRIGELLPLARAALLARWALGITFIWLGLTGWTETGEAVAAFWLGGHLFLSGLGGGAATLAMLFGALQLLAGVGLLIGGRLLKPAALFVAGAAFLALTLFLTNDVWIAGLGGFPAIGAGQGILKYLGLLGLGLFLARQGGLDGGTVGRLAAHGEKIMLAGIAIVLIWIGGMKFTLPEAQGIDPLLRTSPFFSWMTEVWSLQGASNVIGVIEIATALALLARRWTKAIFVLGCLAAGVTFLLTLSFLITFEGSFAEAGFPFLSRSGVFLIKDLALLGATTVLLSDAVRQRAD